MFIFDLFESSKKPKKPESGAPSLYKDSDDPRVKNMLDRAYRENPRAKSDVEALAGHMDTVDKVNKKQDIDLAKSRKDYDELHKDLLDKEDRFKAQDKRFKDFVDQVAHMDMTPPEQARAAQDFEKGNVVDIAKYKKPKVGINPDTGTPYGPTPVDASAPKDKTKPAVEPKTEPKAEPAPAVEPTRPQPSAFPNMATQLTAPSANDDLSDIDDRELPSNIVQLSKFKPQEPMQKTGTTNEEANSIGHMAQDIMARSPEEKQTFDYNTKAFMVAYLKGRPVKLKFGRAWVTLTSDEAVTIYEYVMHMFRPANKAEEEFNLLLSDLNEFRLIKQKVSEMQASLPFNDVNPQGELPFESKNYWKKLQEERNKKLASIVNELENSVVEAIPYALSAANANAEHRRQGAAGGGYRGRIDMPIDSREDYLAVGQALKKASQAVGEKIEYGLSDGVMSVFSDSMDSDELDQFIDSVLTQGVAEAGRAGFRASDKKRHALNAMSDEERRAHDKAQQEKQRKRDDARLERERQKLAAKKGVTEAPLDWQGTVSGTDQAARTDHTFDEAIEYMKTNYPTVKQYRVRRAEPGFRSVGNSAELRKSEVHVSGVDGAVDYLQLKQNGMMSGSRQITYSIGYSWMVYENRANGIGVLYYQDRGMGPDEIYIGAKTPEKHNQARQVFRDAGVLPTPKPRTPKAGMEEGRDWDEGNTEPGNNFAVYINGRKWKVIAGGNWYADSLQERQRLKQLQDWAAKKSAQSGKEWKVYITGEAPTMNETSSEAQFNAGQTVKVNGQLGSFVKYVNPLVALVNFDSGYGAKQYRVPVNKIQNNEVVSEEGSEETVDEILYKLTYAYRRIQHAEHLADWIKDDCRTIYELLRGPLKADDIAEYLRMRKYVAGRYPDAWDNFTEQMDTDLAQEDSWHGAGDEWHGTGDAWHGGDGATGVAPDATGLSGIPGLE